jgi:hypothetical protein
MRQASSARGLFRPCCTTRITTFEELTLRGVADIGEFFHLANPWRQWRQAPRLNQTGGLCLGSTPGGGNDDRDSNQQRDKGLISEWRIGMMFMLISSPE